MDATRTHRTSWQLARLGDVSDPDFCDGYGFDNLTDEERTERNEKASPGAKWLRSLESDAWELLDEDSSYIDDAISEWADNAVPVYTHQLWTVFVDLAAYQEDVEELAGAETDMNKLASIALYMIAERVIRGIVDENTTDDDESEEA